MAPLKSLVALASAGLMPLSWAKQVHFDLKLTWQKGAPDGNARDMIFMNDQFPGPELRIDQGDDVEVSSFVKGWKCVLLTSLSSSFTTKCPSTPQSISTALNNVTHHGLMVFQG